MKTRNIGLALFLMLMIPMIGMAQFDKDVVVTKAYTPTISDAFKLNVMPKIKDTLNFKPEFSYQVVPMMFKTSFEIDPINPAKIVGEPLSRLYGNYVKLGFGSDISPLAEVKINSVRSRKYSYGIEAGHHSSYGSFKIDEHKYYSNFSDNYVRLYGTKFLKNKSLSGKFNYNGNKIKYYGFVPKSPEVAKKDISDQMYNHLGASARLKSDRVIKSKIDYDFDLGFYYFADTEKSKESSVSLKADFRDHVKNSLVGFDTRFSLFDRNSVGDTLQHILVQINPWVQRQAEEWQATLGANMFSLINPDANSETFFYPNIKFQFALADKFLLSYFGFTGKLENHYFLEVAEENPFIWAGFETKPTQHKKIIFAGFKANISSKLSFDIKATYDEMKDNMLFVVDSIMDDKKIQFVTVYDDMDMFNLKAEVVFNLNEKLDTRIKGNYYSYFTLKKEQQAWHKPDFDISLAATYNMQDKLLFHTDLFMTGNRYARGELYIATNKFGEIKLESTVDVNLGVEYRYTRKISAFLNLNNLIAAKYYQYNYYPTQRFHAQVGVTYAF
ncbi:MAG: hypothetical protein K9H64_10160 [Bacteroidales bacterium]|nr:hypothetical protein [Bacteroidales bacterium]MCF8456231.1 hypothetical protein [Bacteroidales bacterium]